MANDRTSAEIATREKAQDQLSPFEDLLRITQADFQQAMPQGREAGQLVRDAMHCLRTTRGLSACSQASIMGGLMTCAQLGLRPGVANLGEAWLIPYKIKQQPVAQLVVGYRGFIKLMYNSAQVVEIVGRAVHEKEPFEYSYSPSKLVHGWAGWGAEVGPVVGYYAKADLAGGGMASWLWSEEQAETHRQKVMNAPNFRGGPWKDWPEEMKIKQCVRRIIKWVPTALVAEQAQAVDGSVRTDPSPTARPEDASQIIDSNLVDDFDDNPLHGQNEE